MKIPLLKGADVMLSSHYTHHYLNSDALVRTSRFQIEVSKTGFINEAGHCLVLYAMVDNRPIAMVFSIAQKWTFSRCYGGQIIY